MADLAARAREEALALHVLSRVVAREELHRVEQLRAVCEIHARYVRERARACGVFERGCEWQEHARMQEHARVSI